MRIVSISSKRQITIPKDLLAGLNLPQGKVILKKENGALLIEPLKSSIVEQTAGSLRRYIPSSKRGIPFSKILRETKRKTAAKLAKG